MDDDNSGSGSSGQLFMSTPVYVVVVVFTIIALIGALIAMWILAKPTEEKKAKKTNNIEDEKKDETTATETQTIPSNTIRNRGLGRMRPTRVIDDEELVITTPEAPVDSDDDIDDEPDNTVIKDPKTGIRKGKKWLEKQKMKEERKQLREAEEQERKKKKERALELEEQKRKEDKLKQEAKEKEQKEIEAALEERKKELEKQRQEEYLKWKSTIVIEKEGTGAQDVEQSASRLEEFIAYIKKHKVVLLEDLASNFNLKTKDVIDRLKELETQERISGVIDERGKFIFISPEELDAVARYIKKEKVVLVLKK